MLESAGVLIDGELQPKDLRQRWITDAVQLFWDRQILEGNRHGVMPCDGSEDRERRRTRPVVADAVKVGFEVHAADATEGVV